MAKKLLCVLLSVLMVVAMLPMGVVAENTYTVAGGPYVLSDVSAWTTVTKIDSDLYDALSTTGAKIEITLVVNTANNGGTEGAAWIAFSVQETTSYSGTTTIMTDWRSGLSSGDEYTITLADDDLDALLGSENFISDGSQLCFNTSGCSFSSVTVTISVPEGSYTPTTYYYWEIEGVQFGGSGWGNSTYDATTSTITFVSSYTGRGWWIGTDSTVQLNSITVETDAGVDYELVVEYTDGTSVSGASNASGTATIYTYDTKCVKQIYLNSHATGDLKITDVEYEVVGTSDSPYIGRALTLDGKVGVTYYFDMSNLSGSFTLAGVVGADDYFSGVTASDRTVNGYTRYTVYVDIADITSDVKAYLTDSNGTVIDAGTYSVEDYCNTAIDAGDDEQALCEALLTYGYYAGATDVVDYDDLSNTSVSISEDYGATTTTGVMKTLALDEGITIVMYLSDDLVDSDSSITVGDLELELISDATYSGYSYRVEFAVPAQDMDKMIVVSCDGDTLTTYSVYSYIMNMVDDADVGNLCKAIYNYGQAASAYTNWQ